MMLVILGLVVVVIYLAVALAVARMCSINSRWEDLVDRIPNPPRITKSAIRKHLVPEEDNPLLDEEQPTARRV